MSTFILNQAETMEDGKIGYINVWCIDRALLGYVFLHLAVNKGVKRTEEETYRYYKGLLRK